jgi:hypothetical protein
VTSSVTTLTESSWLVVDSRKYGLTKRELGSKAEFPLFYEDPSDMKGPQAWQGLRWLGAGLTLGMLVLTTGCGGGKGTISGTVSLDGTPLKGGTVMFTPADTKIPGVMAPIGQDGKYTATDVPAGDNTVAVQGIEPPKLPPQAVKGLKGKMKPPGLGGGEEDHQTMTRVFVPERYRSPKSSGLSVKVTGGAQTYDIPLKK